MQEFIRIAIIAIIIFSVISCLFGEDGIFYPIARDVIALAAFGAVIGLVGWAFLSWDFWTFPKYGALIGFVVGIIDFIRGK